MRHPAPAIRRVIGGGSLLFLAAACAEPTAPVSSLAPTLDATAAAAPVSRPARWMRGAQTTAGGVFLVMSDGTLYAGDDANPLLRSTDEGHTWTAVAGWPADLGLLALSAGEKGELYAGTTNGVWRSADGDKWEFLGLDGLYITAIGRSMRGSLFAAAMGFQGGVFRWDVAEDGTPFWKVVLPAMNPREFIPTYLAFAPNADMVLGTRVDGEWKTTDGGETWTYLHYAGSPDFLPPVNDMEYTADGAMLAAWNEGLLRSLDGGSTWMPVMTGVQIEHVVTAPDGSLYAASILGNAWRSADGGRTWTLAAAAKRGMQVREFAVTASGRMLAGDWEMIWTSERY